MSWKILRQAVIIIISVLIVDYVDKIIQVKVQSGELSQIFQMGWYIFILGLGMTVGTIVFKKPKDCGGA